MLAIDERPKKFDEMVGQDIIIREFKNLSNDLSKIPNYMLFEGESSTGKTSLALIIAKLLNCENPIKMEGYANPCNECKSCKDVDNQTFARDIIYLDASTKGKDDIVKIKNDLFYENFGKNKVIIVDEAQELSSFAKGVTLELLEKKVKNVYIILCTMDSSKLHEAVRSRCLTYNFKKLNKQAISDYLFKMLEKLDPDEKIIPNSFISDKPSPLFLLVEGCNGNLRMACNMLSRCVNARIYSIEEIRNEFCIVDFDYATDILVRIFNLDKEVLKDIKRYNHEFLVGLYYKLKKIIADSIVYHNTKYTEYDWQAIGAKKLEKFKTTEKINLYEKLKKMQAYPNLVREDFIVYISDFFVETYSARIIQ